MIVAVKVLCIIFVLVFSISTLLWLILHFDDFMGRDEMASDDEVALSESSTFALIVEQTTRFCAFFIICGIVLCCPPALILALFPNPMGL